MSNIVGSSAVDSGAVEPGSDDSGDVRPSPVQSPAQGLGGRRPGSGFAARRRTKSAVAAAVLGVSIIVIGGTVVLNTVSGHGSRSAAPSAWIQLTLVPERPVSASDLQVAAGLINQRLHAGGVNSVDVASLGDDLVISVPRVDEAVTEFLARSDQIEVRKVLGTASISGSISGSASAAASASDGASAGNAPTGSTSAKPWAPVYTQSQSAATSALATLNCSGDAALAAPEPVAADYLTSCYPSTGSALALGPAVLVSNDIAFAEAASSTSGWSVNLGLDQAATTTFDTLTTQLAHSHGQYAFVVDGVVLNTQTATASVSSGLASLGGSLTELQAKALADALTTGPLPVGFNAVDVRDISIDNVPSA